MNTFKNSFMGAFGTFVGMAVGLVAGAAIIDKFTTTKKTEDKPKTAAEKKMEEFEDFLK